MIRAERVTVTYGSSAQRIFALRNVSAQFHRGKVACVIGPSGSGKTTLLAVLAGLRRADEGDVWVNDLRLGALSSSALAKVRRTGIGLVFQNFRLLLNLNVLDNLRTAAEIIGVSRERQIMAAREALDAVGLSGKETRMLGELSGGEKQRVAIARALLGRPSALLADEPTASLDTENGIRCFELLRDLSDRNQCAIVVVTHDLRIAQRCDDLWHLSDGVLSAKG